MSDDKDPFVDLSQVPVPESEEDIAKEALTQLAKIALGPLGTRTRLAALNTLLTFTKAKPVTKVDVTNDSHDAWLQSAVAANEAIVKKLDK